MTESRSANLRRKVLAHWSRIESSGSVIDPMPRTRHFGATLSWPEWESFVERLVDPALIVEPATLSYIGAVLGPLAEQ
jgi:extradiol dioxygenase family protein